MLTNAFFFKKCFLKPLVMTSTTRRPIIVQTPYCSTYCTARDDSKKISRTSPELCFRSYAADIGRVQRWRCRPWRAVAGRSRTPRVRNNSHVSYSACSRRGLNSLLIYARHPPEWTEECYSTMEKSLIGV